MQILQPARPLGIDANISRRDFLNGVSVAIGASLLPSSSGATDVGKPRLQQCKFESWRFDGEPRRCLRLDDIFLEKFNNFLLALSR